MAAVSLKERVSQSIYHELQEPDSSLCAQHCLNSLLQDQIFTAADLAELGRQLDEREEAARAEGGRSAPGMGSSSMSSASNTGGSGSGSSSGSRRRQPSPPDFGRAQHLNADRSRNMDDSGFFSSQVMDEALKSFDLQLVRWRSERCRDLQGAPENQEAFIFNLSSHWFVIRRFGHSRHFFFDLNSFHPAPKHVSPLYLGLQIDQAEHEGYSVFVVLSTASSSSSSSSSSAIPNEVTIATLPHCPADDVVFQLAEESGMSTGMGSHGDKRTTALFNDETIFTSSGKGPAYSSGFGNEDEELNRAIEESLKQQQQQQQQSSHTGSLPRESTSMPLNTNGEAFVSASAGGRAIGDFGDEDPELAAAIAASLEMAGSTQQQPSNPSHASKMSSQDSTSPSSSSKRQRQISGGEDAHPSSRRRGGNEKEQFNLSAGEEVENDDEEVVEDDESMTAGTDEEPEEKEPTAEELRQRRLARFGGA